MSGKTGETRPKGHKCRGGRQNKVWVIVELRSDHIRVNKRNRNVTTDTAGTFMTLIRSADLGTIQEMPQPQPGPWGSTHHFQTRVHTEGVNGMRDLWVPISQAQPPQSLNHIVRNRIGNNPNSVFLGPAYPVRDDPTSVNDTQFCVSGGIESMESPENAARREVAEEIGMAPIGEFEYITNVNFGGRRHHLFYVQV